MANPFFSRKIEFDRSFFFIGALSYVLSILPFISVCILFFKAIFPETDRILVPYCLLIPALFFFLLRRVSMSQLKILLLFAMVSASPLLLGFLLPSSQAIFLFISALLLGIGSISARYKNSSRIRITMDQLGASMFVHGTLLVIASVSDSNQLSRYLILGHTLLYLCIFFLARQHYVFDTAYEHIANSPTQPSASVRSLHNRVIIILSVFVLLIIPVIVLFQYSIIAEVLRKIARFLIDAFFAMLKWLDKINFFPDVTEVTGTELLPETAKAELDPTVHMIFNILFNILSVVIIVVLLASILRGVYLFLTYMYRKATAHGTPDNESLVVDEVFSIKNKRSGTRRRMNFGEGEEREIRRKYYREVRQAIRSGAKITPSDSPAEIQAGVSDYVAEDFELLTTEYKKHRYGPKKP